MGLRFTFDYLESQIVGAKEKGYTFISCNDYWKNKQHQHETKTLTIVNRVDVDYSCGKALKEALLFKKHKAAATFFIRLHAKEYNPFSFENYRIIREILDLGFEVGLHSEVVDSAAIWNESAGRCLRRDIQVLNTIFDISIEGIASHGGMTGFNNLDFWNDHFPWEFGIKYEAYDNSETFGLFNDSFYISDSEWTRWKCFDKGTLIPNDARELVEHCVDKHPLIYLLTHPDTYYERHPYE